MTSTGSPSGVVSVTRGSWPLTMSSADTDTGSLEGPGASSLPSVPVPTIRKTSLPGSAGLGPGFRSEDTTR